MTHICHDECDSNSEVLWEAAVTLQLTEDKGTVSKVRSITLVFNCSFMWEILFFQPLKWKFILLISQDLFYY